MVVAAFANVVVRSGFDNWNGDTSGGTGGVGVDVALVVVVVVSVVAMVAVMRSCI